MQREAVGLGARSSHARGAVAEPEGQQLAVLNGSPENPRMGMSDNQRSVALMIKEAIQANSEIDNLPDFWYAQLALVNDDNLEASLSQALSMQHLREEYGIRDTLEDAKRIMWDFLSSQEGWMIGFRYMDAMDSMVTVLDLAAIDANALATKPDGWKTIMAGTYYIRQALNPDLVCVANGVTTIHECEGFDWKKFGTKNFIRVMQEVIAPYPELTRGMSFFHTGVLMNLTHSMMKPFLPKDMGEKCKFGCQFPQGIQKAMLGASGPRDALLLNYGRIMRALECRYGNERNFKL